MSDIQHVLDRRQELLTEAILHRKAVLTAVLRPVGGKAPFMTQITTEDAFKFWSKYRYEPEGKAAISRMTPIQIAELDTWLARESAAHSNPGPGPLVP